MLKPIAGRWSAWRSPQARQARKARRRQDFSDAAAVVRKDGPSATEVYVRGLKDPKR